VISSTPRLPVSRSANRTRVSGLSRASRLNPSSSPGAKDASKSQGAQSREWADVLFVAFSRRDMMFARSRRVERSRAFPPSTSTVSPATMPARHRPHEFFAAPDKEAHIGSDEIQPIAERCHSAATIVRALAPGDSMRRGKRLFGHDATSSAPFICTAFGQPRRSRMKTNTSGF